jgi:transcriptional regulator with XRE-family HTH domain
MTNRKLSFELALGQTIRLIRKNHSMSQEELGKKIGLCQNSVCRIEKGDQELTSHQLFLLSQTLEISIDELFRTVQKGNIFQHDFIAMRALKKAA